VTNTWKSLTSVPAGLTPDTMILLTDASVLVHNTSGKEWYRLTPDSSGHYDTGSWSGAFSMANTRQFFASGVLLDGRVFVLGGEYSDAGDDTPLGEIFDPRTDTWSAMVKPASFSWIMGDVSACILTDGRVLTGALLSNRTALWDPATNVWTEAGTAFGTRSVSKVGRIDEETWTLLPDGTVLTVDISATPFAEKYVPATDTWVPADTSPATLTRPLTLLNLPDTTVNPPTTVNISEIGPSVVLPDGRLLAVGATGHTALYTPPADPADPGFWVDGPDLPPDASGSAFNSPNGNLRTAIDAPAVLLPGGKVLVVAGDTVRETPSTGVQFWSRPCSVYVYDPNSSATPALLSKQPPNSNVDTWKARFLLLPTGQVLFTAEQSGVMSLLTLDPTLNTPDPGWKPVITGYPTSMARGHHYQVSGRQLNGLSQACAYGDDAQMGTNYPIVRLTGSGGAVTYVRSFGFSTLGIATGSAIHHTLIEVPSSLPAGAYTMQVIANGIPSDAVPVTIATAVPAIAVNLQDGLRFGRRCAEPSYLTVQIFNVGGLDLIVDSVARLSGSADFTVLTPPTFPLTIRPGDEVDVTVEFAPGTPAVTHTAVLRITSNDPVTPWYDIRATGSHGSGALATVIAAGGDVGDVCVGHFADLPLTLTNHGTCELSVHAVASSAAQFAVPDVLAFPLTVAPGTALSVPIRFRPTQRGDATATISVFSDVPNGVHEVTVRGHSPSGRLAVTGSLFFGEVDCGTAEKTIYLSNVGDCGLHVSSVAFKRKRRHFKLVNNPFPATLRPGATLDVVVRYRADCEPECCELVITSDDPEHPTRTLDVTAYTRCTCRPRGGCEAECQCRGEGQCHGESRRHGGRSVSTARG